jgi:serine/threonine protein kinase
MVVAERPAAALADGPNQPESIGAVGTMDLEVGARIGDFEIEGSVGAGGMGIVYRARQVSLDRVVALKILGPALHSDGGKARFRREAQAIAKLNHPGIASVYFIGQDEEVCFFAMEFVDGVSLRRVMDVLIAGNHAGGTMESAARELIRSVGVKTPALERFDEATAEYDSREEGEVALANNETPDDRVSKVVRSPAYIARCCEIARDVAQALAHAHERGVIHRDIKPENLLLDEAGKVHVVDFGLARFYDDLTLTNTGALVGTPMYMSPEQVSGRIEVDHRTDLYSLGLVLYEMLTLRRPIEAASREGVLRQVMTKSRPPVSRKNSAVSRDLESVVHKAIAHDPDDRYESAGAFAADLKSVIEHKPVTASPYRYKADLGEIPAQRPRAITVISILMIALSAAFQIGCMVILMRLFGMIPTPESDDAPRRWWLYAIGALLVVPSVGLYAGYSWARWVVSAYLAAFLAFVLRQSVLGLNWKVGTWLDLTLSLVAAVSLANLHRRKTSDWLRFAKQVRAEQAKWRVAGHR